MTLMGDESERYYNNLSRKCKSLNQGGSSGNEEEKVQWTSEKMDGDRMGGKRRQ